MSSPCDASRRNRFAPTPLATMRWNRLTSSAANVSSSRAPMEKPIASTGSCSIPLSELEWRFTPSGGPGGQHANRSNTRVEVRFDVATSPSLGERQRARLLERLGPTVRVVADDERSQARNRALALERLRS